MTPRKVRRQERNNPTPAEMDRINDIADAIANLLGVEPEAVGTLSSKSVVLNVDQAARLVEEIKGLRALNASDNDAKSAYFTENHQLRREIEQLKPSPNARYMTLPNVRTPGYSGRCGLVDCRHADCATVRLRGLAGAIIRPAITHDAHTSARIDAVLGALSTAPTPATCTCWHQFEPGGKHAPDCNLS